MNCERWMVMMVGLLLWGCAGVPVGDGAIKEIPPVPAGFVEMKSTPTSFRSAEVKAPEGTWKVNYEGDDIVITTGGGQRHAIPWKWYPVESGADAALCIGYQPPFPRPPVRPDGWFRGLPSEANS